MVEKVIEAAIEEFRKYRYPEADVEFVSLVGSSLKVKFSGHFCETCGYHDYFDDFVIFLEEKGVKAVRKSVEEREGESIVIFEIKS